MDERTGVNLSNMSSMEKLQGTDDGVSLSVSQCRLCVSSVEGMVPIFSDIGKELQLAYKINKLLPIMITPLDMLPQEVCYTCIKQLYMACEFVSQCLVSQAKLRNELKIKEMDDSIPCQMIQDYSAHWSDGDSFKIMGYSRELHMKRLNELGIHSEENSNKGEGRNGQLKQMKPFHDGDDDGSDISDQSVYCADMDTDLPSYNVDNSDDVISADVDSVRERNATVAKESNECVTESFSAQGSAVDEFKTSECIKYLCKFCGEGFAWKADLFNHQVIGHSDLVIRCIYCFKIFYDKDEFIPHELAHQKLLPPGVVIKNQLEVSTPKKEKNEYFIEQSFAKRITHITSTNFASSAEGKSVYSHDSNQSNRTCYYCNLVFPTLKLHRLHVRKQHPLRFPCRFCPVTALAYRHLRAHEANHKRKSVTCTCKKVFYFADDLRDHRLIHMHGDELKCEVCGDTFTSEGSLEEHIRTHDGESSYLCEACGESFESFFLFRVHKLSHMYPGIQRCELCDTCFHDMEELDSHLAVVHRRKKIQCSTCGEGFFSMASLNQHREKQKCTNVSCKVCGKVFTTLRNLRMHSEVHYPGKNYLCDRCGKGFQKMEGLRSHIRGNRCMITVVPCDVCGRTVGNQARLNVHMQVHREKKKLQCDVCGKTFLTSANMRQHMITHQVPNIPCLICGILFVRKSHMLLHMKRHRVACNTCGEVFENTPLLVEHQKTHSEGGESSVTCQTQPELYECDVCGKQYITSRGLKLHKPIHSDERPYKCNICDKRYRRQKDLAKHTRKTHRGPQPYRCRFCPCTYVTQQMLLKHENGHTVGKPFKCDICGLGFWSALSLEKHLVKHANDSLIRKYVCNYCGKSFPQQSSLISHKSTHTKHLNYKCSFCPRKFSRFGYLKRHKCPFDPSLQISSTSIQGSTYPEDTPTILADGSILQLVQPEDPGGGENVNAEPIDFYRHLKTVTNTMCEDVSACKIVVESSDEEEYMGPMHPHLRYPDSSKTVQLVSDIPVYVRKRAYENLVLSEVSSTTLARHLLEEVFTEEALRKCSVKGQRQNSRNIMGKRESLCPHGTSAIIAFVQKRNDSLGRPHIKSSDIVMAMGHRLLEIRRRPLIGTSMDPATENAIIEIQVF